MPRRVVLCMGFLPQLGRAEQGSWIDGALQRLRYTTQPARLRTAVGALFERALRRVRVPGVDVRHVALAEALDGTNTADYEGRAHPSAQGGRKVAHAIWQAVTSADPPPPPLPETPRGTAPPSVELARLGGGSSAAGALMAPTPLTAAAAAAGSRAVTIGGASPSPTPTGVAAA